MQPTLQTQDHISLASKSLITITLFTNIIGPLAPLQHSSFNIVPGYYLLPIYNLPAYWMGQPLSLSVAPLLVLDPAPPQVQGVSACSSLFLCCYGIKKILTKTSLGKKGSFGLHFPTMRGSQSEKSRHPGRRQGWKQRWRQRAVSWLALHG